MKKEIIGLLVLGILVAASQMVLPLTWSADEAAAPAEPAVELGAPVEVAVPEMAIPPEPVMEPETVSLTGNVLSVDAEAVTVVIEYAAEGAEAPITAIFKVAETAEITKADNEITLADVKEGDSVAVEYTVDAEGNSVISVLTVGE